jgi:hypothetical protein
MGGDEMNKNTLGIKEMEVVKTREFFEQYVGKVLTFWIGVEPIYFSLGKIREIVFRALSSTQVIMFFGTSDNIKFAVGVNNGFGFKVEESNEHIWVDKVNEEETAVIVYEPEPKKEVSK